MQDTIPIAARRSRRPAFLFAVAILVALGIYAFRHAGLWLIRQDPLEKAQAILVLSGGLPARAISAAEIYRDGYAKEVWLTTPLEPRGAMAGINLPYAGEEEYDRMVLISKGVPPEAIRILPEKILNTADEIKAVNQALGKSGENKFPVIIVTSASHTRRVHAIWRGIIGNRARLIVRAAANERFDAEYWWRDSGDAYTVVREYLGLLNAWAGLPLHRNS